MRRGLIVNAGLATAATTTTAAHNDRDPYRVADDHHSRSIQYAELDNNECDIREHQSGDSAGRHQYHTAEWPGVGNAYPDYDIHDHGYRVEWDRDGNSHRDRESGGSDRHIFGFTDGCFVGRVVHPDLVQL